MTRDPAWRDYMLTDAELATPGLRASALDGDRQMRARFSRRNGSG